MDDDLFDEVGGGGGMSRLARYIVEGEEDAKEEEELLLVHREQRPKAQSDTSSLATPAKMVRVQTLSISVVEYRLEEAIPEALQCA